MAHDTCPDENFLVRCQYSKCRTQYDALVDAKEVEEVNLLTYSPKNNLWSISEIADGERRLSHVSRSYAPINLQLED